VPFTLLGCDTEYLPGIVECQIDSSTKDEEIANVQRYMNPFGDLKQYGRCK
jgi:hypothetical protein